MAGVTRTAVFLCSQGGAMPETLGYKRLKWAAETAPGLAALVELEVADQAQAAAAIAASAKAQGLTSLIVAGCPLLELGVHVSRELAQAGLNKDMALFLELCHQPAGGWGAWEVAPGARQSLLQALAVAIKLEESPWAELQVATDVLVLGGGLTGLLAARELSAAGYGVILANPGPDLALEPLLTIQGRTDCLDLPGQVLANPRIQVLNQARLVSLGGTAGRFTARLVRANGHAAPAQKYQVGAVVVAQGPPLKPNLGPLAGAVKMAPGLRVLTLNRLAGLLLAPDGLSPVLGGKKWPRIGLAVGLGREAHPGTLRSALSLSHLLLAQAGAEVTLFTGNAKVAAPDLEPLSQEARAEGLLLVKFSQPRLEVETGLNFVTLTYRDEIINRPIRQEFDLLAVDEAPAPDEAYRQLAESLCLTVGPDGSLQPEQVGVLPTLSPRAGVFIVGPARGQGDLFGLLDEVKEALFSIRLLLRQGKVLARTDRVAIDKGKCAVCLTCLRACPERAMDLVEDRPWSSPLACTSCGTCAAECPQDAIQVKNMGDERFRTEIHAAMRRSESGLEVSLPPELLVFACAHSAGRAIAAARARGVAWPAGINLIQVPCTGMIDLSYILGAFREGFDGVLILWCHEDACYSLKGNNYARYRSDYLEGLMAEAGLDLRRFKRADVAAFQENEVLELIRKTRDSLAVLGPNPLKAAARSGEFLGRFTAPTDQTFTLLDR